MLLLLSLFFVENVILYFNIKVLAKV